jgi:hypothetical protein
MKAFGTLELLQDKGIGLQPRYLLRGFVKKMLFNPDWRTIDRKVPIGISFLGVGTITVAEPLRYLA